MLTLLYKIKKNNFFLQNNFVISKKSNIFAPDLKKGYNIEYLTYSRL